MQLLGRPSSLLHPEDPIMHSPWIVLAPAALLGIAAWMVDNVRPPLSSAAARAAWSGIATGGTRTEPKLEAARGLLPAPKEEANGPAPRRGSRATVCVTDFNGAGHLDLRVGDFTFTQGEKPKLTEAEQAAEKEAQAKYEKFRAPYTMDGFVWLVPGVPLKTGRSK
jgi:hypothetical protein